MRACTGVRCPPSEHPLPTYGEQRSPCPLCARSPRGCACSVTALCPLCACSVSVLCPLYSRLCARSVPALCPLTPALSPLPPAPAAVSPRSVLRVPAPCLLYPRSVPALCPLYFHSIPALPPLSPLRPRSPPLRSPCPRSCPGPRGRSAHWPGRGGSGAAGARCARPAAACPLRGEGPGAGQAEGGERDRSPAWSGQAGPGSARVPPCAARRPLDAPRSARPERGPRSPAARASERP